MTTPPRAFRYFAIPRHPRSSTWKDAPGTCGLCEREGPGYEGPFSGEEDCAFVCEECLAGGRLEDAELTTNQGDVEALRAQLAALDPDARDRLVRGRTAELEHRTPPLVTWQDLLWPAHCGDYCRFEEEVGLAELNALAPDRDGWGYLQAHVAEELPDDLGEDDLPRDAAGKPTSIAVYRFRCIGCARDLFRWDCD